MWQALRTELHPRGVEVVTVALDVDPERARPWIEQAAPEHPSLVDRAHLVDELFGIVNVPNSVWIDEQGTIVRPAEPAPVQGSIIDRLELPPDLPPAVREMLDEARKIPHQHEEYLAALRDWAANGSASRYALAPDEVLERADPRPREIAEAAAHFELGERLHELGDVPAAQRHWREAHRLQPDNWTYKRQAWELVSPGQQGRSEAYDGSWLDDVRAIGAENYYPQLRL